jgi:hypothetical protein
VFKDLVLPYQHSKGSSYLLPLAIKGSSYLLPYQRSKDLVISISPAFLTIKGSSYLLPYQRSKDLVISCL